MPFTVFARQASLAGIDLREWAGHTFVARTARLVGGAVLFVPGQWLVVAGWR